MISWWCNCVCDIKWCHLRTWITDVGTTSDWILSQLSLCSKGKFRGSDLLTFALSYSAVCHFWPFQSRSRASDAVAHWVYFLWYQKRMPLLNVFGLQVCLGSHWTNTRLVSASSSFFKLLSDVFVVLWEFFFFLLLYCWFWLQVSSSCPSRPLRPQGSGVHLCPDMQP